MYTLSLSWPQPQSSKWKKTTCKGNTGFHTPEIDYNSIPLVMSQQRPEQDGLGTDRSVLPVKMYREVISVYFSLSCQNIACGIWSILDGLTNSNVCFIVDLPSPHHTTWLLQRYSQVQLIMQMLLSSVCYRPDEVKKPKKNRKKTCCQVWTATCWIVFLKAGIWTLSGI